MYAWVPRQFVYGHFVYDTSSTDISSTDISPTTVYQCVGQLYIELLFQQIIIFINSNFYLHYDSLYQSHFHFQFYNTTYIVSKHCDLTIQLQVKSSQISFIAWKIRKIGEASADTAATEAHYMKGYYNLEEETIKVKI